MYDVIHGKNGDIILYDRRTRQLAAYSMNEALFDENGIYDLETVINMDFDNLTVYGVQSGTTPFVDGPEDYAILRGSIIPNIPIPYEELIFLIPVHWDGTKEQLEDILTMIKM